MLPGQIATRVTGEILGVRGFERDAQAFERAAHRADDVHAAAHQAVADLDLQQIALSLLALVLDGIKHGTVKPRDLCKHPRIVEIALAVVFENGPHLARIGDEHLVIEPLEKAAYPRTVRTHFHHHQRAGIFLGETPETFAMVGDIALVDDFASRL